MLDDATYQSYRKQRSAEESECAAQEHPFYLRHLRKVYSCTRQNAPRRGIGFSLSYKDVEAKFMEQRGRCALTKLRFNGNYAAGSRRRPWIASIDRIDSNGDYTARNTRLVCSVVNYALQVWDDDVFYQMCAAAHQAKEKGNV